MHGSADEVIPVEDAYKFSKIIPNHKLHITEGANHSYTEHQAQLVPLIVDFIKACLQQDKETSSEVLSATNLHWPNTKLFSFQ